MSDERRICTYFMAQKWSITQYKLVHGLDSVLRNNRLKLKAKLRSLTKTLH